VYNSIEVIEIIKLIELIELKEQIDHSKPVSACQPGRVILQDEREKLGNLGNDRGYSLV
jgi:hypothetical protein